MIVFVKLYVITVRRRALWLNKDENVHRFELSAIRGVLLERERERELVLGYYTERDREFHFEFKMTKKCDLR